LQEAPPSSI